LYYLLVEGEVSRAKVADIIWGDRGDEKKIRSSMRNAIYVLRKAFGYDFLQESQKNVIGIHPDCRVDLDISRLTDPRGELQGYPGDFLEDFHLKDNEYYNDWVQTTRQRFNRICLERLKQEMTRAFDREDWERCEAICLRLLELDEFDESIYCSLMEVYRLRGEYSKATALYAQLQKLFAEELFQAPGQEATRLMESIKDLRNQKVTEIIAQKSQPEQKVQGELFYGRIEELEQVTRTLRGFRQGRPSLSFAVQGETGIGKTCLLQRALEALEGDGTVSCFQTRCYRAEESYTLKPWQSIFEQVIACFQESGMKEYSDPFVEAVANVFPFLRKNSGAPIDTDEIATIRYNNSERTIGQMLIRLAQQRKMVLLFDDLQWADNITIALIQDILTSDQNKNILFLFSCRMEKHPRIDTFLEDMSVSGLLKKLTLSRFSYEETIELADLLLPNGFTSEESRRLFHRETGGNPFFIVETVNCVRHNGSMADITPNMRDSIYSSIMLLTPECRNILNLLSIFFDGVSFELLLELSNREEYELIEILETLLARQLLQESVDADGVTFQFRHQKVLEYVYGELSMTKKQILHNKTGCCLEGKLKNNGSDLNLYTKLMYHFQRSGNRKKYLKYYVEYVYSYLNGSHEYYPVIVNYRSKSYAGVPDIAATDNEGISRMLDDIRDLVNQELENLDEEDCLGFLSDYYHMMGRYHIRMVEYEQGSYYIRKLIELNRGRDSLRCRTNMIKAHRQLICIYINRCEIDNMRRVIEESFRLLDGIGKQEELAIWMRLSGLRAIMSGELTEGEELLRQAIGIFERSEEQEKYRYNLAASYAWLGEAERYALNYDAAQDYYERAITMCRDYSLNGGVATFYTYAGQAALDSGDLDGAERYLSAAVRQYSAVELMWGRGIAYAYYGHLCLHRGRYEEAFRHFDLAEGFSHRLGSSYEQGVLNRMYGGIALMMEKDSRLRCVFGGFLDQKPEVYLRRARKLLEEVCSLVDQTYLDQLETAIEQRRTTEAKHSEVE